MLLRWRMTHARVVICFEITSLFWGADDLFRRLVFHGSRDASLEVGGIQEVNRCRAA